MGQRRRDIETQFSRVKTVRREHRSIRRICKKARGKTLIDQDKTIRLEACVEPVGRALAPVGPYDSRAMEIAG